jgi:MFS family permease
MLSVEVIDRPSSAIHRALLWVCQFVTSLVVLALPPFFAFAIPTRFPNASTWVAGLAFIAPLLAGAIAAPYWGRLADKLGRTGMVVRAQLGLSLGFLAASYANSVWQLLAALVLQGALGGTFGATRAAMLEVVPRDKRRETLEILELAPRLALIIGPLVASYYGASVLDPNILTVLACVPLVCASIVGTSSLFIGSKYYEKKTGRDAGVETLHLKNAFITLFALFIGGSLLSPFAIAWTVDHVSGVSIEVATLLALLPNIVFALAFFLPHTASPWSIPFGLIMQVGLMAGTGFANDLTSQLIVRLMYSICFVLNWRAIHGMVMATVPESELGHWTGSLDAIQKCATIGGSAFAAMIWSNPSWQPYMPLFAGVSTVPFMILVFSRRRFYDVPSSYCHH